MCGAPATFFGAEARPAGQPTLFHVINYTFIKHVTSLRTLCVLRPSGSVSKSTRKTRPFSLRFVKLARHHAEDLQAREGCVCVDK